MKKLIILAFLAAALPLFSAAPRSGEREAFLDWRGREVYIDRCLRGLTKPQNLYDAVLVNNITATKEYIAAGEDVNKQLAPWGMSPLMIAASDKQIAIIELLLTAGANVCLQNCYKQNVLDYMLHSYLLKISISINKLLEFMKPDHEALFNTLTLLLKAGAQPAQDFSELCSIVSVDRNLTTSWPYVPAKTKLLIASLYQLGLAEYVTKEEIKAGYKEAWPYLNETVKSKLITEYHIPLEDLPSTDAPVKAIETIRVITDDSKSDN